MLTMEQVSAVIEAAVSAPSLEDVRGVMERLCHGLGYELYSYSVRFPEGSFPGKGQFPVRFNHIQDGTLVRIEERPYLYLNNWPKDSLARYVDWNLVPVDPALHHGWNSPIPLHFEPWWFVEQLNRPPAQAARIASVFQSWAEDDVATAFTVGLQGPQRESATLTLSSRSARGISPATARLNAALAQGVLPYLHHRVMELRQWLDLAPSHGSLTERERECLRWASEGKTAWEIGQILHISERTAVAHLTHATAKLGANNRIQAVARALIYQVI